MQIIVTSWSRAGLPVSRLRIQDELVEMGCESLCFNDSEARSFLNDVGGLQLSGSDVDALTASTDGWAAALQLAALSLRSGGDANSLIGRLSGASDVVGEFLAENVVDTLEPELREFLRVAEEREGRRQRVILAREGAGERVEVRDQLLERALVTHQPPRDLRLAQGQGR